MSRASRSKRSRKTRSSASDGSITFTATARESFVFVAR